MQREKPKREFQSYTVRISPDLYRKLEQRAQRNKRSLNKETEMALEKHLAYES